MKQNVDFDPELEKQLAGLRSIPARDAQMAARGRAAFLAQAEKMRSSVPLGQGTRLNQWVAALAARFRPQKKEYSPMFSILTTLILVLGVLFGGSGITLAAAQASLPDQPLYGLKMWTEQVRYSLAGEDVESQMQLSLQFSQQRFEEIMAYLERGNVSDNALLASVKSRFMAQVDHSLRLATGQNKEADSLSALSLLDDQLKAHLQKMDRDRVQSRTNAPETALMKETRAMIQNRLAWTDGVTSGELSLDQLKFALKIQTQFQQQQAQGQQQQPQGVQQQTGTATQTSQGPFKPAAGDDTLPAPSFGPGPGDGTSGSNYNEVCDEVTGICVKVPYGGSNPGAGYGPGSKPTELPTPRGPQDNGPQSGPGPQTSPSPKKP